jgi:LysR family hydrogen peroxide-inducible transcriptional activator
VLDVCKLKGRGRKHKQFSFESGSLETLKSLVEIYGGYTLLPEMAAEHVGNKGKLIPFERPIPAREIGLVYRREHYKIGLVNALAEAILKAIPENLKNLKAKDLDLLPI